MKTKILFLTIFLVLLSISTVAAGDNTTDNTYIPKSNVNGGQVVEATESGNFNITFSNDITNNNHTIIIDNSTSIIQNNNYTNITYVNFTKTENNITVIYNCAIINIGCGNTTNIMNETIDNSSTYLSKSLNNQSQNQLNDYIMMKLAGNKKAKILLVIMLVIMMLCIGGYGYRRKI